MSPKIPSAFPACKQIFTRAPNFVFAYVRVCVMFVSNHITYHMLAVGPGTLIAAVVLVCPKAKILHKMIYHAYQWTRTFTAPALR